VPRWFDFGAEPYERRGTPQEILSAFTAALTDAQCALIPGYPLIHPDHAELSQLLLSAYLPCRVGPYAEQPYLFQERIELSQSASAPAIESLIRGAPLWTHLPIARSERRLKKLAVRVYRSQMRQLGLSRIGRYRMLRREAAAGGDAIAWVH